jgi:hypothetical protein
MCVWIDEGEFEKWERRRGRRREINRFKIYPKRWLGGF